VVQLLQKFEFLECGTAFYRCLCSYSVVQLFTDVCVLTVRYRFYKCLCSYNVVQLFTDVSVEHDSCTFEVKNWFRLMAK
jgi:hypothetical protein